jgi:WD40 repeat protein
MSQATSLSVAPDGGRVAVAGRELLRTFALGGDGPSEVVDLLAHTRKHSSHSSNDVTWLPQRPSQLVTASISGEVLLWDTTRRGSKLVRTMAGHGRAVNRVSCNSSEPPRLLSGSQDCTVRLWDLNARSAAQLTFGTAGEVRDVQWASPVGSSTAAGTGGAATAPADGGSLAHLSYCFAVALETGSVQVFDYRTNRRALHAWQAHLGPAYALEYGLVGSQLLIATGGRDRYVHIWDAAGVAAVAAAADVTAPSDAPGGGLTAPWRPAGSSAPLVVQPLASVQTIAPVGRVKWRPSVLAAAADGTPRETDVPGNDRLHLHIASCAAALDGHLHLWDAARPQVPLYTLRLAEGQPVRDAASLMEDRQREPRPDVGMPVGNDRPIGEAATGQVELVASFNFLPVFGPGGHGQERLVALTRSGALTVLDVASAEPPYTNVSPVALCWGEKDELLTAFSPQVIQVRGCRRGTRRPALQQPSSAGLWARSPRQGR